VAKPIDMGRVAPLPLDRPEARVGDPVTPPVPLPPPSNGKADTPEIALPEPPQTAPTDPTLGSAQATPDKLRKKPPRRRDRKEAKRLEERRPRDETEPPGPTREQAGAQLRAVRTLWFERRGAPGCEASRSFYDQGLLGLEKDQAELSPAELMQAAAGWRQKILECSRGPRIVGP
jgi:hypothetical protein